MNRCIAQPGFALLLTLAVVLLAGAALATLARRSAARTLAVKSSIEELQRRWAVQTAGQTLLERAPELLLQAEGGFADAESGRFDRPPVASLRLATRLADQDFLFVLTDEQARLHPNALVGQSNFAQASESLRGLLRSSDLLSDADVQVELGRQGGTGASPGVSVRSYHDIVPTLDPRLLIGTPGSPGLAELVTCWGDGRIHLRRASPRVIQAAFERSLSAAALGQLLAAVRRDAYRPLPELIGSLTGVESDDLLRLNQGVTDKSLVHALWVVARGPQRSWHSLTVAQGDPDRGPLRRTELSW